jgi:2-amino-4-hydroxy-6-hydroxymethyldihydropteridine diphosphokinase
MNELIEAYLNLGSNIQPELHLPKAIQHLKAHGRIRAVSRAWQSQADGMDGPDFLNACLLFESTLPANELIEGVLRPIEAALGRVRGPEKFAPRTIDIDLILYDDEPFGEEFWSSPFVIVPLAELLPEFPHPLQYENLKRVAGRMRRHTWIVPRPEVLDAVQKTVIDQ